MDNVREETCLVDGHLLLLMPDLWREILHWLPQTQRREREI